MTAAAFALIIVRLVALMLIPGALGLAPLLRKLPYLVGAIPLISIGLVGCVMAVFSVLHVATSPLLIVGAIAAVTCITAVISACLCRGMKTSHARDILGELIVVLIFCLVGSLAAWHMFLSQLEHLNNFTQQVDIAFHMDVVRAFMDSGQIDIIHPNIYAMAPYAPTISEPSFYPALYHALAAFGAWGMEVDPAFAMNALNVVTLALIYPMSCACLVRTIVDASPVLHTNLSDAHEPKVWIASAVICMMSEGFPWRLLNFGPLYPNFLSLCALPALLALLYCALSKRSLICTLFMLGATLGLALVHPNTFFSALVLGLPLAGQIIYVAIWKRRGKKRAVASLLGFIALCCVCWYLLFIAPPLQNIVTWEWDVCYSLPEALGLILVAGYRISGAQLVSAVLLWVGIYRVLRYERRYLWIVVAWLLSVVQLVITETSMGFMKQLLTGFWYTDGYRIVPMCVIAAIMLMTIGTRHLIVMAIHHNELQVSGWNSAAMAACLIALAVWGKAGYALQRTTYEFNTYIHWDYNDQMDKVRGRSDYEFLKRVKEEVGNAAVLNNPQDGSGYAYGELDLQTVYRSMGFWNPEKETATSLFARKYLPHIHTNDDLAAALRSAGIEWLVLLDVGRPLELKLTLPTYDPEMFAGVQSINDSTPGFSIRLMQGTRRLYHIDI